MSSIFHQVIKNLIIDVCQVVSFRGPFKTLCNEMEGGVYGSAHISITNIYSLALREGVGVKFPDKTKGPLLISLSRIYLNTIVITADCLLT